MPYKLSSDKKAVMQLVGGKWKVKKRYQTKREALKYFRALKINVRH